MKHFSTIPTALVALLSISTVLALPHKNKGGPSTDNGAPKIQNIKNFDISQLDPMDETAGSGGAWTAIVDQDDPRSLSDLFKELGVEEKDLTHIYNNTAFKGFAGKLSSHCVHKMNTMSGLKAFEPEIEVRTLDVQVNAPWGLQRISQGGRVSPTPRSASEVADNAFRYSFEGSMEDLGKGVDIYIVDTGINTEHVEFQGRVGFAFSFDGADTDLDGHGSHCAGTAAGTTFGISKAASLTAVRVLGADGGRSSDIIKGIEKVVELHKQRSSQQGFRGSVISMSLGSAVISDSIDFAVMGAASDGIHVSVAAGNENQDACRTSPANTASRSTVVSVGATNINDRRASFSNFGECTTVYAPGQTISSAWIGGSTVINTIDGTSMACPHVTGLMAYLLSKNPSLATDPAGLKKLLTDSAVDLDTDKGVVKFVNNGFRN